MISTGLCGALDPALRVGDIVVPAGAAIETQAALVRGAVHSIDHVAVTSLEKRTLRNADRRHRRRYGSSRGRKESAEWKCSILMYSCSVGSRRRYFAAGFQPLSQRARRFLADADCAGGYGASLHSNATID